jgi:hypothetical protein
MSMRRNRTRIGDNDNPTSNREPNTMKSASEEYFGSVEEEFPDPAKVAELTEKNEALEQRIGNYQQTAIVSVGDGFLFRNFSLSKIGIRIDGDISPDDADALGHALKKVDTALQFWFGDWANLYLTAEMDDNARGEVYDTLATKFNLERITLRNYASICRILNEVSLRRDTLTFSHHKEIAFLPEILKGREVEFLDKAALGDEGKVWSVRRLREEIEKECAKLESSEKIVPSIDLASVTKSFRSVAELFIMDTSQLKDKQRDMLRQTITTLRHLLDDAETKLNK